MNIGIVGVGVVGGTLKDWLNVNTFHQVKCYDPGKGMYDDLIGCDAIFISVPVDATMYGQDSKVLLESVVKAKKITNKVFIRSTVLPGTNDSLGTISMPEYLTERRAYDDFDKLPLIFGTVDENFVKEIFPTKKIIIVKNVEAELAKYTHNCFGAFKVTYFNMIKKLCDAKGANFEKVKEAANVTGFLGKEHMSVPGPDFKYGFGNKCFPTNMESMEMHLRVINDNKSLDQDFNLEAELFSLIRKLNFKYRGSHK